MNTNTKSNALVEEAYSLFSSYSFRDNFGIYYGGSCLCEGVVDV